ncbi:MAG: arylsulfatase A-like enzyme [Myxococcota bacterium]|jgi:arylsulfatase A-like enzyme
MKQLRPLIALAVLLNVVLVAWLLFQQDPGESQGTVGDALAPLVATTTFEEARYDLSDRAGELNLIVISLDALRYDRTGFGGSTAGLTRNLDQFAEEAVVFHDVVSAAPWTLPSHMSMWTARWPSIHGVTNKLKLLSQDQMVETSLSPGIATYPDHLIEQGFRAVAFTGGAGVQGKYGFGRGFETYLDDRYFGGFDYTVPAALEWLQDNRDDPFFLFLHGYDTHGQFPLPGGSISAVSAGYDGTLDGSIEENARLREEALSSIDEPGDQPALGDVLSSADIAFVSDVYDRKVRDADQRVGSFLAQLRAMGLLERSIVAIVSDHGDEMMDHGAVDHGATLYQEQLHTVMLIRFPGYARRQDITQPVRTLDLFPTLFDAMGLKGPSGVNGQSLLPMLRGGSLELPLFAETDYRLFVHLRMMRRGPHKLILDLQDGGRELYNLELDPTERDDISSAEPRTTYELEQALRTWMDETRTNPEDYLGVRQKPISIF